jgi:hypothetical protein
MKKTYKLTYSIICGIIVFVFSSAFVISFLSSYFGFHIIYIFILLVFLVSGGIIGYKIEKNQYKKLKIANYVLGTLCVCFLAWNILFGKDIRKAEFKIENTPYSIEMQIDPAHPVLAEYNKTLVLKEGKKELVSKEMFMDTGGYLATKVFKVDDTHYEVVGDFDAFSVNILNKSITSLSTTTKDLEYKGVFDTYKYDCDQYGTCTGFKFILSPVDNEVPNRE